MWIDLKFNEISFFLTFQIYVRKYRYGYIAFILNMSDKSLCSRNSNLYFSLGQHILTCVVNFNRNTSCSNPAKFHSDCFVQIIFGLTKWNIITIFTLIIQIHQTHTYLCAFLLTVIIRVIIECTIDTDNLAISIEESDTAIRI